MTRPEPTRPICHSALQTVASFLPACPTDIAPTGFPVQSVNAGALTVIRSFGPRSGCTADPNVYTASLSASR